MKILTSIAEAVKGKTPPGSAKLSELIVQAEAATSAARDQLAALEGQHQDMVWADEADRRKYRSDLTAARDDVADGEAAIAALHAKHAEAIASEAEAERSKAYKAAKSKAAPLAGLIAEYAKLADAIRDVVAKIADIDRATTVANKDLPAGASALPSSQTLRSVSGQPREVLSEKSVELWLRPGSSDPLGDEWQKTVQTQPDGSGLFPRHGGGASKVYKGTFVRREVREAVSPVHAASFDQIVLPAAFAAKPKGERKVVVELTPVRSTMHA